MHRLQVLELIQADIYLFESLATNLELPRELKPRLQNRVEELKEAMTEVSAKVIEG